MKHLIFSTLALFCVSLIVKAQPTSLPLHADYYIYTPPDSVNPDYRGTIDRTFNLDGRVLTDTMTYINGTFNSVFTWEYFYTAQGLPLIRIRKQKNNGSNWAVIEADTFIYDSHNNQIRYGEWKAVYLSPLLPFKIITESYTYNGNLVSVDSAYVYYRDINNSQMYRMYNKYTVTNNANGEVTDLDYQIYDTINNVWTNHVRIHNMQWQPANYHLLSWEKNDSIFQHYIHGQAERWFNSAWQNFYIQYNIIGSNGGYSITEQHYSGSVPGNYYRQTMNIDSHYFISDSTNYLWLNNQWNVTKHYVFDNTYNGNDLTQTIVKALTAPAITYTYSIKYIYSNYFNVITKANNILSLNTELNLSPNPANDKLLLHYNLPDNFLKYEIIISDVSGKIVHKSNIQNPFASYVNTEELKNGFYFVSLVSAEKAIEIKKIIVAH